MRRTPWRKPSFALDVAVVAACVAHVREALAANAGPGSPPLPRRRRSCPRGPSSGGGGSEAPHARERDLAFGQELRIPLCTSWCDGKPRRSPVAQVARNFVADLGGRGRHFRLLVRYRDTKFTAGSDAVMALVGVKVVRARALSG